MGTVVVVMEIKANITNESVYRIVVKHVANYVFNGCNTQNDVGEL